MGRIRKGKTRGGRTGEDVRRDGEELRDRGVEAEAVGVNVASRRMGSGEGGGVPSARFRCVLLFLSGVNV